MLNQKGMATIEMIPILILFVVLVNFTLGFFGVIHSGILNSIAARNYAFESFRNRANLNYLRDENMGANNPFYSLEGFRYHSIVAEDAKQDNSWVATKRPIKFSDLKTGSDPIAGTGEHNSVIRRMAEEKKTSEYFTGQNKNDGNAGVSPVWIMTTYGICLNATCGT